MDNHEDESKKKPYKVSMEGSGRMWKKIASIQASIKIFFLAKAYVEGKVGQFINLVETFCLPARRSNFPERIFLSAHEKAFKLLPHKKKNFTHENMNSNDEIT